MSYNKSRNSNLGSRRFIIKKLSLLFFYVVIFSGAHAKQNAWDGWRVKGGAIYGGKIEGNINDKFKNVNFTLPPLLPLVTAEKGYVGGNWYFGVSPTPLVITGLFSVTALATEGVNEFSLAGSFAFLLFGSLASIDVGYIPTENLLVKGNLLVGSISNAYQFAGNKSIEGQLTSGFVELTINHHF